MGHVIKVKGDFNRTDVARLEQYLRALVQDATGEPVGRVVLHGVLRQRVDQIRESYSSLPPSQR